MPGKGSKSVHTCDRVLQAPEWKILNSSQKPGGPSKFLLLLFLSIAYSVIPQMVHNQQLCLAFIDLRYLRSNHLLKISCGGQEITMWRRGGSSCKTP